MVRIILSLMIGLLLVACGNGHSSSEKSVYEELLGFIPDTPENRSTVWITDHAKFIALVGAPVPGPDTSERDLQKFLTGLTALPSWGIVPPIIGYRPNIKSSQYLALDLRNADQSIIALNPSGAISVIRGRFEPKATDNALRSCSRCPTRHRGEHKGIPFYSWDDKETSAKGEEAPPPFAHYVRGRHISIQDNYIFDTRSVDAMKGLIDASLGERNSLADVEGFRLLAKAMTQLDTYAIVLNGGPAASYEGALEGILENCQKDIGRGLFSGSVGDCREKLSERLGLVPMLRSYQAFAMGVGANEDGPYLALVLVHRDERLAEENVGLLRRHLAAEDIYLWSQFLGNPSANEVDNVEIGAEGRILSAKLRGRIPSGDGWVRLYGELFRSFSPLLLYE